MRRFLAASAAVILVSGCSGTERGRTTPDMWAADRVAGLAITTGPSGLRPGAPAAASAVAGSDGGDMDRLAAAAVDDVQAFWKQEFPAAFDAAYQPVAGIASYDSRQPGGQLCGSDTTGLVNAFYCRTDDTVSWDRGQLLPTLSSAFGPVAVVTVLAHEIGHAVQSRLADRDTSSIVTEQRADCYAGSYFRWVAEGRSDRVQVSTGPGLNQIMSTLFFIRDGAGDAVDSPNAHGNAFDRVSAFQLGFGDGAARCARIDDAEVRDRVTQPDLVTAEETAGNLDISDPDALNLLDRTLVAAFAPAKPRLVKADGCGAGPAAYCGRDDTVELDLGSLAAIGAEPAPGDRGIGDFAAFAEVASRYALAYSQARGLPVQGLAAAQRTACLTGAWAATIVPARRQALILSPGDLDEAVAEMLAGDSLIAADVDNVSVPSGFARVDSFRRGFTAGGPEGCLNGS